MREKSCKKGDVHASWLVGFFVRKKPTKKRETWGCNQKSQKWKIGEKWFLSIHNWEHKLKPIAKRFFRWKSRYTNTTNFHAIFGYNVFGIAFY